MAFPLPDKPSIAVLPFKNLSGEAGQEFLADGITESIIGAISRVSGLFVIASNSVFTYKGKAVKVQQVSEELGVRNVLEGTVQRSGDRLRVNAQLIDATTGRHLWSEKYDREMKDIFSVQDDISKEILGALRVNLVEGEQERVWAKGTKNLEAYLKFLKAYDTFKSFSKQNMILTRQLCEEAIALDPNYEQAYSLFGCAHLIDVWFNWGESPRSSIQRSEAALKKALILNPHSDFAHANLNHLYLVQERHDEAVAAGEKSLILNPNRDYNMVLLGITFNYVRRYEEAITLFKEAQRRNPYCPAWYIHNMANSYRGLGRWDEAIAECKRALQRNPDHFPSLVVMASVYGMAGRIEEGRAVTAEILRINPGYCIEKASLPFKYKPDAEAIREGFRKVGIPEKPSLPLPDKPSIAVLPFVNMSGDKSQEYFSDGLTEEIITALSKTPKLFVIARNSTFVYKGKPVNVQQVSRELGVQYVLEGSVRRSGDQLRITAQLIDATTGNHLWAERYDREMKDLFVIQDEITMKIISYVQVKLTEGEAARFYAKGTESLDAYLKVLEGRRLLHALNRDDNTLAQKKFEEAIASDPNYAGAYALLGFTYVMDFAFGINREESMKKAVECSQKALSLDDSQLYVYTTLEFMYGFRKQHEEAIASGEKAVRLAPGSADAQFSLGRALNFSCSDKDALIYLEKAVRMNPFPPAHYFMHIGSAHLNLREYEEAVSALKKALAITPRNEFARSCLMVAYVEMGRVEEAKAEIQEYRKTNPKPLPPELYEKRSPWKDPKVTERFIEAMRKLSS